MKPTDSDKGKFTKRIRMWSISMLMVMGLSAMVACGGDDSDDGVSVPTVKVTLTSSNLTDDGYFDGMMYYKITSNSPLEVTVHKAEKSVIKVEIPNIVNIDGKNYQCTSISKEAFSGCSSLTSVSIPNCITNIGNQAFSGCSSLTTVTIPNSVTSIDGGTFYGCSGLHTVTSLNQTPPIISYSIFDDYSATLQVPTGCKTAYQNAEYWNKFKNIVEIDPSDI